MLTNDRERRICERYSVKTDNGIGHLCYKCPMLKASDDKYDFRCKANSHYNRNTREWEYDEESEEGVSE